jgi:membrane-associated protein
MVCLFVYASTGLFFCFFLPSGAILFTAGVLVASGVLYQDIFTVCSLLIAASVAGSLTGYWFGGKADRILYNRKNSAFYRRHLITAETFYKKHGGRSLIAAYFLPIIRSFAPVVGGMIRVKFIRFIFFTVIGSTAWIISFVAAGYFIGSNPVLKPWLKYIVIGFIVIVTIPIVFRIIKQMRKPRRV